MKEVYAHYIAVAGNKAQAMVLIGEGQNQRSITRHCTFSGNGWIGRSVDFKHAVALNNQAQGALDEAVLRVEGIRAQLKKAEGKEKFKLYRSLSKALRQLDEARAARDKVRTEHPTEVAYVGPSLTFRKKMN